MCKSVALKIFSDLQIILMLNKNNVIQTLQDTDVITMASNRPYLKRALSIYL